MTKRTLWYMCLGLLCCGALAMVVFAAGNVQGQASTPRPLTVKSAAGTGLGNTPPAPSADVMLQQTIKEQKLQEQAIKEQKLQLAREQALAAPAAAPSATAILPASPEIQAIYDRWIATGTATPEEKAVIEHHYFRTSEARGEPNPMDAQGGPDAFGYSWVDNQAPDTAQYNWIELCGDPNATNGPTGDDASALATLGWSFPFYGGSFTSVNVSTNGMLSFGVANSSYSNVCIAANNPPAGSPQILAYWDDGYAAGDGGCNANGTAPWIRWRDFGTYFVVEWKDLNFCCSNNAALTYEAILYPDGKIKFQYGDGWNNSYNPASATIGIDASGAGLEYSCNVNSVAAGRAIWFYPGQAQNGRCCYNNGANCVDNLPADCAALGGTWTGGMTCAGNPCPQLPWNDNCTNVPPLPCPISTTGDNSLATNDCALTGGYDGETWHAFTVSTTSDVSIRICGSSGTWQNFWIVITQCPCASWVFNTGWTWDATCANGGVIVNFAGLAPGDYWYPVMHSFTYGSSGPYTIDITCTPVTVGRCCYNQNANCADNTQSQCTALGGTWDGTLNCTANPCPPPPPCTADYVVTAPYTSPERTTVGSLNDCALVASEEHIYQVTIPVAGDWEFMLCDEAVTFWDSYLRIGTACCTADIWSQDDGCGGINYYLSRTPCLTLAAGTYWVAVEGLYGGAAGGYILNIQQCAPPPVGRCCYGDPTAPSCVDNTETDCSALAGTWDASLNCTANPCEPCDVTQPAGSVLEGEPDCADEYVDSFNGGCNSTPYVFSPILCNQTVFGESGTFLYAGGQYRDTDWYRLQLDVGNTVTWTVTAEFPLLIFVINGGTENCADYTILGSATAAACQPATLTFAVPSGVYWFWVGPSVFTGVACGREYVASLTTATPCTCDPATDLTVYRGLGPANAVNLRWYASQTQGIYRVFGTTEKNNDGDPNNGADPQWSLVTEVAAPAAPGDLTASHTPLVAYMNYAVVHDCAPRGRCCYGDPGNPSCQSPVTQAQCDALSGSWTEGLNCTDNPCPVLLHHDLCQNAEVIPSLPYTDTDTNLGADLDCPALGYRSVWYTFTTTSVCNLTISYCGTSPAFGNAFIVLETSCPCAGAWTFATSWENTSCGDGNWSITWSNLPAGTYWAPILTDVGSEGPYTVTFACSAPPVGRCCYTGGCANNTQTECNALGGTWTQGLTCEANPCPTCAPDFTLTAPGNVSGNTSGATDDCAFRTGSDQIVEVTIPTTGQWTFSLCPGSGWDTYLYLSTGCCTGQLASNDDYCGLTSEINCYQLTAGTYYVDVEPWSGGSGAWTLVVSQCGGGGSYCTVSHTYCDEYIGNVTMGSINNTTGCTAGGYNDYTGISTTMTVGSGVPITVTNPVPYSTDATGVWVDWDNNFLFTDAGEYTLLTNQGGGGATFTGTITAPAGSVGSHRMRVRIGYSWTPNPCGSTTYGETEDYTLVVQ